MKMAQTVSLVIASRGLQETSVKQVQVIAVFVRSEMSNTSS